MLRNLSIGACLLTIIAFASPSQADNIAGPAVQSSPPTATADQNANGGPQSGTDVPRYALLIGNAAYDPVGDGSDGKLPNLENPCRDVTQIAGQLVLIGWKDDNVKVVCDQTVEQMLQDIKEFSENINDDETSVGLLYFAGHGLRFGDDDYLFGTNARLNTDRLVNEIKSDKPILRTDAVALAVDINREIANRTAGAVVIVLDSCRDNPFFDYIDGQHISYIAGQNNLSRTALPPADGVKVAYSTQAGQFAHDGLGELSPYAEAFSNELLNPKVSIDSFLNKVTSDVIQHTQPRQKPSSVGNLLEPPTQCFAPCDQVLGSSQQAGRMVAANSATSVIATINTVERLLRQQRGVWSANPEAVWYHDGKRHALRLAQATSNVAPQVAVPATAPSNQPSSPKSVFSSEAYFGPELTQSRETYPLRVDVFFCSGGPDAPANEARAEHIASEVSELAKKSLQINDAPIDRIRVRELSLLANSNAAYGVTSDQIRFDDSDLNVMAWSGVISNKLDEHPTLKPKRTTTPGYVTIYACSSSDVLPKLGQAK